MRYRYAAVGLAREEKDPGSAFGTGVRPVGHGLGPLCILGAGPFKAQPPVQTEGARRTSCSVLVPRLAKERAGWGPLP